MLLLRRTSSALRRCGEDMRASSPWAALRTSAAAAGAAARPERVIKSPYSDVTIPAVTLPEYVWQGLEGNSHRTFVECAVTGRMITYGQARDASVRLAVSLTNQGRRGLALKKGDVVGVVLPNGPEFPVSLLGALEAGLVVSTINPLYTAGEISKQLLNSGAKVVITDAARFVTVSAAAAEAARGRGPGPAAPVVCVRDTPEGRLVLPQGAIDFAQLTGNEVDVAGFQRPEGVKPEDLALLPYSSGTTGLPKGVMLSHRNVVSNLTQMHHEKIAVARYAAGGDQDVFPVVLPFFHAYALSMIVLNKMHFGAKLVALPRFEPVTFLKTLQRNQSSGLYLVPPLLLFLSSHEAVKPEMLASLRFLMCGAAPIGPADVERLIPKTSTNLNIIQAYGMTETSPVVSQARPESRKIASVGPPHPSTELYIRDVESGQALGPNQTGEICCRGPQVMMGYLNNEAATAETVDAEGFIHMGDIGYHDEDGDFYIVDRLKELIKSKGYQVAPAELEEILRTHPSVGDAAVVGVPDERWGEAPRAYIVPKPGASKPDPEAIAKFVASKVVDYKQLKGGVRLIDAIPKNPSGKILRRKLRELN